MVPVVRRVFLVLCLLASIANGAVSIATVWQVRTTGNDANGGGFVAGASGTDFSNQNAAQCTATDFTLVTTTTATSAACPFGATSVGNIIHVTAGANCTAGFYQVVSVAVVTATLDRVAGTVACTAGTFAIGGALALPNTPCSTMVEGNTLWVKGGTYTVTATCLITATNASTQVKIFGYTTTQGDGGKATWTTATNSTQLIAYSGTPYRGMSIANFNFSNTAGTRAQGVGPNGNTLVDALNVENCVFDGFSTGLNLRGGVGAIFTNVEVKNSTGDGIAVGSSGNSMDATLFNVYSHANGADGIDINAIGTANLVNVVSAANTGDGVHQVTNGTANDMIMSFVNVVLANNGSDGFESTSATIKSSLLLVNSIIYGNTSFGVKFGITPNYQFQAANAYGANGTNRQNFNAGTGDVALSANPFTNAGSGDFSLNATAGGGAALKAVGFPGVSLFGTGFIDIGALQSAAAAPATQRVYGVSQ